MTNGEAIYSYIGQYILSSISYIGETFSILSAIFIMVCLFGKEVKITRKTFIIPSILAVVGILNNLILFIMSFIYARKHWNEEVVEIESSEDAMFVYNLIIRLIIIALVLATSFFTFKKHKILNGLAVLLFSVCFETYLEFGIMYSVVYFTGNPRGTMEKYFDISANIDDKATTIYVIAFTCIMIMLFLALYLGMYKKQRFMYIGWKYRIFLIVWEIFMFIMPMMPLVDDVSGDEQSRYMGYVIGTITPVLGIAIPFLIITMISRRYAVEKTIIQESYIASQLDYINQYKQSQNETRAFRHDIINNLSMLSAMLADKNYDEAGKHLETLLGEVKGMSPKYVTGDEMLDCIVGMKAAKMEEEGIEFSIDGVADGGFGMKPVDVCSIFANAMDNAIEACEKLPSESEKWIKLVMKRTDKFFSVKLKNTMWDEEEVHEEETQVDKVDADKLFGDGKRITTKKDKNLHGFGTLNMKAAISKYDGLLKAETEDGIFTLSIMIPRTA